MKKEYVSPRVDIIYTNVEDALLKVSGGGGGIDDETHAKAYDFGQSDFSDESMWGDEADGNN
ncbi:hypothetical protein BFS16_01005 [Hoylesella timonensis]|uniref:Uncharacterized protein n=1 Tax=Hoylesella timonensis TaxID=386414 RepID=A0A2K0XPN7_9BACT|nr:hypothetical protein [Hoylesella timonensis]PNP96495.1 hypothetical protein BFS16_01005 [Hoylesella timonensis]